MKNLILGILFILPGMMLAQTVEITVQANQNYEPLSSSQLVSPEHAWAFFEELVPSFGFSFPSYSSANFTQVGCTESQIDLLSDNFDTDLTLRPFLPRGYQILDRNYDESKPVAENMELTASSQVRFGVDTILEVEVLIVEWNNVKHSQGSNTDSISYQVWCYSSGVIEYRYGPWGIEDSDRFTAIEVSFFEEGVNGKAYHYALQGDPQSPTLVANPGQNDVLIGVPQTGTVYRFVDPTVGIQTEFELETEPMLSSSNPTATGIFQLHDRFKGKIWKVFDLAGQEILQGIESTIDLSNQPEGMYLLKMGVRSVKLIRY